MILRIIIAVLVLIATCIWLKANWVTFTQEELALLEDKHYHWPRYIGDDRIDELVKYAYNHCVDSIWDWDIIIKGRNYSCKDQALTRTAENWAWGSRVVSPTNDHWICQLNYKRHNEFIDNKLIFNNPLSQIEYCQEVREDAMKKWKMPRVAYNKRNNMKNRFR